MALVETIVHFREYLYGIKFTVFTDHSPLVHYKKLRLSRLITNLTDYDFDIRHVKGKANIVPDILS